jgi:uncharacterized membrane protein YhiD involved in acid resistance
MIAIGSTTYMLLAEQLMGTDTSSVSRTLQGFLSGIGFLGGAVIFKSGFDVKGSSRGLDHGAGSFDTRFALLKTGEF